MIERIYNYIFDFKCNINDKNVIIIYFVNIVKKKKFSGVIQGQRIIKITLGYVIKQWKMIGVFNLKKNIS